MATPGGAAERANGPVPVDMHVVDPAAAEAFGIGTGGAVLVRPDGQVTLRWPASLSDMDTQLCATCTRPSHPNIPERGLKWFQ